MNYPRDMIGYGGTPPHANWPGGARVAVQFVLNYEEGGENAILHGDPASAIFLSESIGAAPFEGARHMPMESIYEYGSRAGVWRILDLFRDRDVPLTLFAVAMAMERHPAVIERTLADGHKSLHTIAMRKQYDHLHYKYLEELASLHSYQRQ